jgi:hypothetical protein
MFTDRFLAMNVYYDFTIPAMSQYVQEKQMQNDRIEGTHARARTPQGFVSI